MYLKRITRNKIDLLFSCRPFSFERDIKHFHGAKWNNNMKDLHLDGNGEMKGDGFSEIEARADGRRCLMPSSFILN